MGRRLWIHTRVYLIQRPELLTTELGFLFPKVDPLHTFMHLHYRARASLSPQSQLRIRRIYKHSLYLLPVFKLEQGTVDLQEQETNTSTQGQCTNTRLRGRPTQSRISLICVVSWSGYNSWLHRPLAIGWDNHLRKKTKLFALRIRGK